MLIDAHMHLWNKVHGQVHGQIPVTPISNGVIQIGEARMLGMPAYLVDCQAKADLFVAEMDAQGVDAAVVVQEYLDGEQNEYLLDVMNRHPGRFFVHGLPNWFEPDTVYEQVATLLQRGFKGVKLPAHHLVGTIRLNDNRLMRVYESLALQNCVLAVDLSEGQDEVPAMEEIIEHNPTLRIALGHFGMPTRGGWPGQLNLCRHEHVHLETGGIIWLYRNEGYPFSSAIDALRRAADTVGIEKVMWGSDWPRTMVDFTYRQSIEFIRQSTRLSDAEKGAILGDNAQRLYQFSVPEVARIPLPVITEG